MALPPALVIGGAQMAVSAARSLAAIGVEVHAVGDRADPIRHSRACASFTEISRTHGLGEIYLDWLERGPRGAVLLPADDESLEVVGRHRRTLEEWGYLPVEANDEVLLAMLDKTRTNELARAAGVPAPRTQAVRTHQEAERAAGDFDYPCALKPVSSHLFAQAAGMSKKLFVVHDREELLQRFDEALDLGTEMLLTEIVPGPDEAFCSYYSYLMPDGAPLFELTKHKLRQKPIGFGLTCYQETVWQPDLIEVGRRFCQGVGLRGVACVEFKHDHRDGAWKIIECNHRFSLANEIVRLAGIDIPVIAYRRAAGQPVAPIGSYRKVRMWNPIEDASAFVEYRAAGELGLAAWIRSLLCRWHFPMWRLSDPAPTAFVLLRVRLPDLSRNAWRRVLGRLGRARAG